MTVKEKLKQEEEKLLESVNNSYQGHDEGTV